VVEALCAASLLDRKELPVGANKLEWRSEQPFTIQQYLNPITVMKTQTVIQSCNPFSNKPKRGRRFALPPQSIELGKRWMLLVLLAALIPLVTFAFTEYGALQFAYVQHWLSSLDFGLPGFAAQSLAVGMLPALAAVPVVLTEDQVKEFQGILADMKGGWTEIKKLPDVFASLKSENETLRKEVTDVRRLLVARGALGNHTRLPGLVSEECARHLTGVALAARLRSGKQIDNADYVHGLARDLLGVEIKTALSSTDIPLPIEYSGQVVELVSQFGAARRYGTLYPLGAGVVKLPQLKTDPAFGLVAQSAGVAEKSPQTAWVTFSAEKYGGLVRVPSELDADSIVAIGQFIARYAARQIARIEDVVFFTNDGVTFGAVEGLTKSTITNAKVAQMAATKTRYSDATLVNIRAIRAVVDAAAIAMGSYYMHPSFEQHLSTLNTAGDKPYQANAAQGATLDGFPIRWVDVLPAYSSAVNVSKVFMLFGDLSFQYLGVRGAVRFDTSVDAAFATDEILIRALERFTIGLMATGAASGLQTAAS
jgi:HK97 family phage major capsid protein